MTLFILGIGLLHAVVIGRTVAALNRTHQPEEEDRLWTSLAITTGSGLIVLTVLLNSLGAPPRFQWPFLGLALPLVGGGALRMRLHLSQRRTALIERTLSATTAFERLDALEARKSMVDQSGSGRRLTVGMSTIMIAVMGATIFGYPPAAGSPVVLGVLLVFSLFLAHGIAGIRRDLRDRRYLDGEIDSLLGGNGCEGRLSLNDEAS